MPFQIPDDLSAFSVAGLSDLKKVADDELTSIRASVTDPEAVTDEQLARMEELHSFAAAADANIQARNDRATKFASLAPTPAPVTPLPAEAAKVGEVVDHTAEFGSGPDAAVTSATVVAGGQIDAAGDTESAATRTASGTAVRSVQIADVAPIAPTQSVPVIESDHYTIIAAADVPNIPTSKELDWDEVGEAFEARARGYTGGQTRQQHGFALIQRALPEHQQMLDGEGDKSIKTKLAEVVRSAKQKAGEVNSLVAANGWCAPSETIYTICNPVTAEGLLNIPEVQARRGGIRHNRGIDWATFFGGTFPAMDTNVTGMTILTEAQVIAATAKTCLTIDCPTFVDERLNVGALCLTSSLLQNRGYPEYVSEFTQGALAAFAHFVNREVIDIIEDGSTAVALAGLDPWDSDGSVVSNIMSAVEMAVVDMTYRLRLSLNAVIDFVFPEWVRAQMRADWMRRNAVNDPNLADAVIASMFATRRANVQYVMDWQDAFSGVAGGVGALTAITALPATVRFLAFPPGTWILARQDVIRLDTVYDSTNLTQNLVTQLFMEDGWLPMRMCPLSRVYSMAICPTGSTGAQRAVDCVTP